MSKRNLVIWAAVAAVMAGSVLLIPPDQRASYVMLGGAIVAVVAASSWLMSQPWCVAYVERNPRRVRLIGWAIAGVALAVVIAYPALALGNLVPMTDLDVVIESAVAVGALGWVVASAPTMAKQIKRARWKAEVAVTHPPQASAFSPFSEGWRAPCTIIRNPMEFLQIAGPWAVALAGCYFAVTRLAAPAKLDRSVAFATLALIIGTVLILVLSIPTTGVAWARWIGRGQKPGHVVALPDRAALSVFWRLCLFNVVEAAMDRAVSAQAATLAKSTGLPGPDVVGDAAGWIVEILAVVIAGMFAVRLAALALGDKDFRVTDLGPLRRLGFGVGVGLALAMAPPLIAAVLFGNLADLFPRVLGNLEHPDLAGLAWISVEFLLLFAGVASAAAYLTRAYQAATAKP